MSEAEIYFEGLETVEEGFVLSPAGEKLLFDVQGHASHITFVEVVKVHIIKFVRIYSLELHITVEFLQLFVTVNLDRDRFTFRIELNSAARIILISNLELNQVTPLHTCRDKLLSVIEEEALLDCANLELDRAHQV